MDTRTNFIKYKKSCLKSVNEIDYQSHEILKHDPKLQKSTQENSDLKHL